MTESLLPEHRERLYPPTVALSMFMRQVLSEDGSCQKAVDGWAAQRAAEGLSVQSINTGAYCKARSACRWRWSTLAPTHGTLLSERARQRVALARTMREVGRWHGYLDARHGSEPGVLSAALEPSRRSGLAAGALVG